MKNTKVALSSLEAAPCESDALAKNELSGIDALSETDQQRLAAVVESYLVEMEQGLAPDPEQLIAVHPDLAGPLRTQLEGLRILHQATLELAPAAPKPPHRPSLRKRLGDYEVVREIGRGGMGVVYEAQQISLNRRVALKLLPFAAVLDQKQIARFKNEALAAAQLHHPHIVPVFSVGCERGVHYYTMQFVEGQSLSEVLRELRAASATPREPSTVDAHSAEATPAGKPLPSTLQAFSTVGAPCNREYIRTIVRLGTQAADALQYAHDCGIVHRDVKPSNLLLDTQGEIWVADFGLAHVRNDASLTVSGDVLGTVRYMSPEQAAGHSAAIDQRTDIYSLGVTLYELLTLQPVFAGDDPRQLLSKLAQDDPVAPCRHNPSIPPDLETVLLKSIAKSPEHRYASAADLASDLRSFLAGKPIRARRPTVVDRTTKWAQRHRALVTSAIAVFLLAVVGMAAGLFMIAREHRRTKTALAHAEHNYRQAREVVDRLGAQYAERLATLPGTESLRRQLLADTLAYYQGFVEETRGDGRLKADLATTHFKMGKLSEQLGAVNEAKAAYRQALEMLEQLVRKNPGNAEYRADLALCLNSIALGLARSGKTVEAENAYRRAIGFQKQLVEIDSDTLSYQADLALTYGNLGLLLNGPGRTEESRACYEKAIEQQRALVERFADNAQYRRRLALSLNNLSFIEADSDLEAALQACGEAIAINRRLTEDYPDDTCHLTDLALSLNNQGSLQSRAGKLNQACALYQEAIAVGERLRHKSPSVVTYQSDLAVAYNNLGQAQAKIPQYEEAIGSFRVAKALFGQLIEGAPDHLGYRSSLGGVLNNEAMILERLGQTDEALAVYREAIEHQRFAVKCAPQVRTFGEFLVRQYVNYGQLLRSVGRQDEAEEIDLARRQIHETFAAVEGG